MDEERLNRAVRGIRMPEDARQRLLHRLKEERPRRAVRLPKRPALAAVAACLALALGLPDLAANVEPAYTLLYRASPAAAPRAAARPCPAPAPPRPRRCRPAGCPPGAPQSRDDERHGDSPRGCGRTRERPWPSSRWSRC